MIAALKTYDTQTSVKEIMDSDFETLNIDDKITNIYANIATNRSKFYPVLENGKLAGVINQDNINEFVMVQSALR